MIQEEGQHYLYRHIRLDNNQVFYVGIGTKQKIKLYKRAFEYSKGRRTSHWKNVVDKTKYKVDILLESDNYEFIKEKEKEFITLYGRKDLGSGTLINMTDGGDGVLGRIVNEDTRKRISNKNKGHKYNVGIRPSKETINKIKKAVNESYQKNPWNIGHDCLFINTKTNESKEFNTIKEGSKYYNLNYSCCIRVAKGERNHTGGFQIKYKNKK